MKTVTKYYQVADHLFTIEAAEEVFEQLPNYEVFEQAVSVQPSVFSLHVKDEAIPSPENWEHLYTDKSDEDMPRIEMSRRPGQWLFRVSMYRESEIVSAMVCSDDWREVEVYVGDVSVRFAIDNAAMLVYAFATAAQQTLLFHSSVTVLDGKAYMFLGHSGTGKSTHSQQWKAAFDRAELLNDDNPVVRLWEDGSVVVYGSPWSGKTPCYKNASAPVQALVQLAQAPENKIERMRMTQAYPYILASVSGLKVVPHMMDLLYESIAQLLERKPVFKLECLPNPAAAELCYSAAKG